MVTRKSHSEDIEYYNLEIINQNQAPGFIEEFGVGQSIQEFIEGVEVKNILDFKDSFLQGSRIGS